MPSRALVAAAVLWAAMAASPGAGAAAEDGVDHGQLGELLRHGVEAAAWLLPARWRSALSRPLHPLSTVELLERAGYPVETWQVETADGHLLQLHRVPQPVPPAGPAPPTVLLLHGMLGSSAEWLVAGSRRSLGTAGRSANYVCHDMSTRPQSL